MHVLAGHLEDGAFKVSVNMMIVDADGEAVRVVIRKDGGLHPLAPRGPDPLSAGLFLLNLPCGKAMARASELGVKG